MVFDCVAVAKKQQCVKYTRIPLFQNIHHIKTYSDSLQQKYSTNDTISNHNHLQQYRGRGEIKTNCTLKAQLYKLT